MDNIKNESLADLISKVLNHPEIPERLYNAMVDELSSIELPIGYVDSPEYIRVLLSASSQMPA